MKRWVPLFLLLETFLLGCGQGEGPSEPPAANPLETAMAEGKNPVRQEVIALGIGGATYEVEVAGNSCGTQLGLMFRKELGPDEGMWFEFPNSDFLKFWMHNTSLPLSIAFVEKEGRISNIEDMVPFDESLILSKRRVSYALEMNRGWFTNKGMKAGDTIRIGRRGPNPAAGNQSLKGK
jgi:hypothetical protein